MVDVNCDTYIERQHELTALIARLPVNISSYWHSRFSDFRDRPVRLIKVVRVASRRWELEHRINEKTRTETRSDPAQVLRAVEVSLLLELRDGLIDVRVTM